jgi:predicted Zn-dependent protease
MTKWLLPIVYVLFILGCGGGSGVDENIEKPEPIVNTPDPDPAPEPDPAYGTPLSEPTCEEIPDPANRFLTLLNLVQDIADGNGGSIKNTVEENSEQCGAIRQMDPPTDCPTTATATGDSRYNYVTCDGIMQKTDVHFPYDPTNTEIAIIDLLAVVDTKLTDQDRDGLSVEQFVQRELDFTNSVFANSGVYIQLRLVDIKMVEVEAGDLRRQYRAFFDSRYEFSELDQWQSDAQADIAFLFKQREPDPIACGVAQLDASLGIQQSRGITQCYQNSVFQIAENTRYYQRAYETFTHEVGHVLGLQHHFEATNDFGLFEYSYGYNLPEYDAQETNPDYEGDWGGYGTIMSYSDLPTGRFSDPDQLFDIPETGEQAQLGTDGGCFCLEPPENQPPPTNAVEHLNRVRYTMSQLAENNQAISFFTPVDQGAVEICLF